MPKISALIHTSNNERTLGRTLESLRNSMFIITGLSTLALLIERVF